MPSRRKARAGRDTLVHFQLPVPVFEKKKKKKKKKHEIWV
jgi:hypothetical protein